jgi:hypothetical protein
MIVATEIRAGFAIFPLHDQNGDRHWWGRPLRDKALAKKMATVFLYMQQRASNALYRIVMGSLSRRLGIPTIVWTASGNMFIVS